MAVSISDNFWGDQFCKIWLKKKNKQIRNEYLLPIVDVVKKKKSSVLYTRVLKEQNIWNLSSSVYRYFGGTFWSFSQNIELYFVYLELTVHYIVLLYGVVEKFKFIQISYDTHYDSFSIYFNDVPAYSYSLLYI